MKIDPYLIRYLEKSQGVKFKIVPTLHKTNKNINYSIEYWIHPWEKGSNGKTKLVRSSIHLDRILFEKGNEKVRDLTILHEARESLITQNDSKHYRLKKPLSKEESINYRTSIHIRSINHEVRDKKFLNEYYKHYPLKFKGYTEKSTPEMYDFEKYKEKLQEIEKIYKF